MRNPAFLAKAERQLQVQKTYKLYIAGKLCAAKTVAAFQRAVPMISGRGLGITGGTLDKLESIPGFNINLDERRALKQLQCIGVFMIRQTTDICPADKKKLYALRDVTGNRAFAIVHCREHHEQEAGGKSRPVGFECEVRQRRIHENTERCETTCEGDDRNRHVDGREDFNSPSAPA